MHIVAHKTNDRFWLKSNCCCKGDLPENHSHASVSPGDINRQSTDGVGKAGEGFFGFAQEAQEDRVVSCPGLHIAGKLPSFTACWKRSRAVVCPNK